MLNELRKPFFFLALALLCIAVLLEGAAPLLGLTVPPSAGLPAPAAGYGVPSMLLLDALLVWTVLLMGVSLLLPERLHGRLQGLVSLVVGVVVFIAALALLFLAIQLVSLMLGLLLAPVFGTVAYFAAFADFDRSGAAVVLGLLMLLKLGFAVCLVLAQQRFLENKGLVLLVACSLLGVLLVSFLHGLVPGFLVSITDMVGAIVITVLALIWAVVFMVGSLVSVVKAIV
jgi:hypothetical protein